MSQVSKRLNFVEYIWLDGASPVQQLRSKTRMLFHQEDRDIASFPVWDFDGSSTWQAAGNNSDCVLKPVFSTVDPLRQEDSYLVLCEVLNADGKPHPTNKRHHLSQLMQKAKDHDPYIGFEQEYTFFAGESESDKWPLGWPKAGYPIPQGPFYCGVGAGRVCGREIVEEHTMACQVANLNIYGTNAEVMLAQWEFQIGHRSADEPSDPLLMADHLWIARYLLKRVAEEFDVTVSFDNKPVPGDWNGAGMHTNFSTKDTRNPTSGMDAIHKSISKLKACHQEHIRSYGHDLESRLTGLHETCHINEFTSGPSHRGASIRIPVFTQKRGHGYFEDRRPGANADPYVVATQLVETLCCH